MYVKQHQKYAVPDKSYASMAKRDISRMAEAQGFSASEVGKVNIVVSELTSNLMKHVPEGGELLVRPLGKDGLEIICLDNGEGMRDPSRMQEDGVSTYGSAGEGLGAIKRQSDEFDLFSQAGVGTIILSRIFKAGKYNARTAQDANHELGYVLVAKPHETLCGDNLAVIEKGPELYLLALDGLGHGENAYEAAQLAAKVFNTSPILPPDKSLRHIHEQIRRTRGAVGFVANISGATQSLSYCGIGNIAGKLYSADGVWTGSGYKNIISYNGILGHNIPNTTSNQQLEWGRQKLLILHSDGIKSRWELTKYPALVRHHAAVIAALLYKEYSRQTDDTMVVVCKGKF
ncbi:ATP-binding protein [Pontibacter akesuensis]|uniref:Anti-sigma regulatory factor (Ser/Thr protein kinase) n=1 Tax=Pontibacter akesuensis TaxID=388950 RepID=A0A1I7GW36_9BACT|nr:ATP-binding protein [Pontibacter akesuensis]GHA54801.1 TorS-related protein [Pontibacter akesuensis]SFU52632.1 Anti-sigma regulatory factor (Ser/Thr protein kinase) [Pontibacter akesuensis]